MRTKLDIFNEGMRWLIFGMCLSSLIINLKHNFFDIETVFVLIFGLLSMLGMIILQFCYPIAENNIKNK